MKIHVLRATALPLLLVIGGISGCAHPVLLESSINTSAEVMVGNLSSGYMNVMTYSDPFVCDGPHVVGTVFNPGEIRGHKLSADNVITVSFGAWGLPADHGKVAWCNPIFVSLRLDAGRKYRMEFHADSSSKKCGVIISDVESNERVRSVLREGSGGLFPGVMAGPISCEPSTEARTL